MKIPLSLIKKFIPIDKPITEISDTLTMLGLEVDGVENAKVVFSDVCAAEVTKIDKHPNSDKLIIVKVFDGKDYTSVVCGDINLQENILVPYAKIGAKIFDKTNKLIHVKKTQIKDIASEGVLLSAKELHLFDEADRVLRLPKDEFSTGDNLVEKFFDPVFEISLTPNLGHCMSAIGVSREIAATHNFKISLPKKPLLKNQKEFKFKIDLKDKNACKKYSAKILENIEVKDSPFWLKKTLMQAGIRSINNVVDTTNYVMLLLGHPLHAFDLDTINGDTITIKNAKHLETFLALNEVEYKLDSSMLVIQDAQKTIAVAGVIGSDATAVKNKTTKILLEAAHFNPKDIRNSQRKLNLRSESSQRFEKGTDFEMISFAIDFAAAMLVEIANATIISSNTIESCPFLTKEIELSKARTNKIIGHSFSLSEIILLLKKIDLIPHQIDNERLTVKIPSYRNDLNEEIDLIEEVLRIYGINNIERKSPLYQSTKIKHSQMFIFEKQLYAILLENNLLEVINSDLISLKSATLFKEEELLNNTFIKVKHSKSEEHSVLRPSLLCAILQNIKYNQDHKNNDFSAFEIGKIHFQKDNTFVEQKMCAIALSGQKNKPHFSIENKEVDFFDIKGIVEDVIEKVNVENISFTPSNHFNFHPKRQANIIINDNIIGVLGELSFDLLSELDIKQRVYFAEFNLNLLLKHQSKNPLFKQLSQYPGSNRDWTFTIDKNFSVNEIFKAIDNHKPSILQKAELISIFESPQIGKDKKNMTFRFYYSDLKKTLSYEETEEKHNLLKTNVASFLKIAMDI
jgi:phenylalanyl-tRNA synthetase beta chain